MFGILDRNGCAYSERFNHPDFGICVPNQKFALQGFNDITYLIEQDDAAVPEPSRGWLVLLAMLGLGMAGKVGAYRRKLH